MKPTNKLENLPETIRSVSEIQKAFKIAKEMNFTEKELDELQKSRFFIQDQQTLMEINIQKGREEGRPEGQLNLIKRQLQRRFG